MREFVSVHLSEERPQIATLLLSRPPTNALTRQVYLELIDAAGEVAARDDVGVVILFGGHEIFCAGDDVPALRTLDATQYAGIAAQAVAAVADIPKPTVAAVTGYALGAGLTLALAADRRISGDNVKVGSTEILADLAPSADATARLSRAIGASKAKDLVFSGRFVGAEEAREIGLIDELTAPDGVYEAALGWARRFDEHPPHVLAAAKAAFADGRLGCQP
ncbi:enoyl-CoA hydratase [Mycobacterium sp. WMMD1722]|uniref:enoyl-CoA hydratase n=1 Tax=Mycobacterium sp. WMMD1722 TaxID=3404117 RepID=UPI003BF4A10B